MKNSFSLISMLGLFLAVAMFTAACQKDTTGNVADASNQQADDRSGNPNSAVFPPNAHMYGKSYNQWTVEWWKWVLNSPCATLPLIDPTGANAYGGQSGPVFYLGGNFGGSTTRSVTIPHGKAVLFPIINVVNNHPCPFPGWDPAPGQSMESFLQAASASSIDLAAGLSVTLDGVQINNTQNYRFLTSLFNYNANDDLVNCFDPCDIAGIQPYVSDGYWMMLKPLSKGQHTLNFQGGVPAYGFYLDVTVNITVP